MPESTMSLEFITEIKSGDSEVIFVLAGGKKGSLKKEDADFDFYMQLAQRSITRGSPIGVMLSPSGHIVTMERSDSDIVKEIFERTKDGIKVWFQGHDGTFRVSK